MCDRRSSTSTRLSSSFAARSAMVSPKKPEPTTTRSYPSYTTSEGSGCLDADRSGVDGECQGAHPEQCEHLQNAVAQRDLLGLAAVARVDVDGVAQHRDHERHDRDHRPRVVVLLLADVERPQAVRG